MMGIETFHCLASVRGRLRRLPRVLSIGWVATVWLGLVCPSTPSTLPRQRLQAEDIVARHLESIGPVKERAAVTTRIISGTSLVVFRTEPAGQAGGRAVLASEGSKILVGMSFQSSVYPREHLGFNGSSFMAAFVTPGVRSVLGEFLMTHNLIFKQGLMSGTLSSAWPLLDLTSRSTRLEYAGTKKFDNLLLYEVRYLPHGGSDLKTSLFFDQDTFRHVRTEYERVIAAPIGNRSYANVEQRETRYKMVEEFADFRNESGLNLPHTYKIKLSIDSGGGTFVGDWVLNLTLFTFNERIDPNSFNIGAR
jgi:hypothetical protein